MKKAFACALCVALFAVTFYAQNQTPTEYNKNEFFAGYSENSMLDSSRTESFDFTGNKSFRGWSASYTYNFRRYAGVKTEVSGYYKNYRFDNLPLPSPVNVRSRIYNFLGGVQFKDNKKNKRFSPFAYALGGVSQTRTNIRSILCDADCAESTTGFSLAIGGGVDLKVRKRFSLRLIQIDYNPAFYNGFREQRLRAGFGIVIN